MGGLVFLHGGPLPPSGPIPSPGFFLWGEGPFRLDVPAGRHPRLLDPPSLVAAVRAAGFSLTPGAGNVRPATVSIAVPASAGRPMASAPSLRDDSDYEGGPPALSTFDLDGLVLPPGRALDLLLHVDEEAVPNAGDDLEYWAAVAGWAFDLLHRRRVVPVVEAGIPRWRPVLTDSHEKDRFELFARAMPAVSRTASWPGARWQSGLFPAPSVLLKAFLDDLVDAGARELLRDVVPPEHRKAGGGAEAQLLALLSTRQDFLEEEAVNAAPLGLELSERVASWGLPLLEPLPEGDLRLGIRLLPPDASADEQKGWRLSYHLEAVDDPSLQLFAEEIWGESSASLGRLGRRFLNPQETLLARLGGVAALSEPIRRSLEERHPVGSDLNLDDAFRFLSSESPLLSEAGVHILLPSEGKLTRATLRLTAGESRWKSGVAVTRFGLGTLVEFDWRIAVGDAVLTPEEFEELAARKVPLVEIRGEWVLLDPVQVQRTLELFDKRPGGRTSLGDFLRLASGLGGEEELGFPIESVSAQGWLAELLDPELARAEKAPAEPPKALTGTLRPYQLKGVSWLRSRMTHGLGCCLADDMGLGKTVQFLATLLAAREAGEEIRPALLVCPTSVVENWIQESDRFAPTLVVAIHHGPERASGEAFSELVASTDLIVTTYSLVHRDRALFSEVSWEYLALDEAQNVKNPGTAQSKAVRSLRAKRRAALTGTPLENRLSELKAIFDVLSPGLLGSDEGFRKAFSIPIERHRDPVATERLRRLTAPFLLRRTKTDPSIAPELPEKIETKEWVGLTREQATLYRATTRALLDGIGKARGQSRRAKVLLLLLRLKQICNHPTLFLGDGSRLDGRSAKLARLLEMLEETEAEDRPSLLFTQFAEMGHLLVRAIKERFDKEVLFLHGGVPRLARVEMVRRFQEDEEPPPFFVLSLKAGGSGLNLTRASHVFHYDRWWNPAVEDQATDRAFRIGQTEHVQVHKFVCRGTLEERIDAMIDEKKDLARNIIGVGESWITELSNEELADLVMLTRDAVEPDER